MNLTSGELAHLILAYDEITLERATRLIEDTMNDARNQAVHNSRESIFNTLKIHLIKLIREWYSLQSQLAENKNSLCGAKQFVENWIASSEHLL